MPDNTNDSDALILTNQQGEQFSLTAEKLEQWFATLERANQQQFDQQTTQQAQEQATQDALNEQTTEQTEQLSLDEQHDKAPQVTDRYLATQALGHFGIKSTKDMITFLKSPAGESIVGLMNEELIEIAEMEAHEEFLMQEEEKKEHFRLGLFLLALLFEGEAAADKLNEAINAQNEARLKEHAHDEDEDSDYQPPEGYLDAAFDRIENLSEAAEETDHQLQKNNNQLEQKQQESNKVDEEITNLKQEKVELDQEHATLDKHLDELDEFIESTADKPEAASSIDARMKTMQSNIDAQPTAIQQSVESGNDAQAKQQLTERQGMQLQVTGMQHALDVKKGHKNLYNEEGTAVNSMKKAHLVLEKDKQMVKDNDGKRYVIGKEENLETIKQSPNAQQRLNSAHEDYQNARSVHSRVAENRKLKEDDHSSRLGQAEKRRENVHNEISTLEKQRSKLEATRAKLDTELQSLKQEKLQLEPPKGSVQPHALKPTQQTEAGESNTLAAKPETGAALKKSLQDMQEKRSKETFDKYEAQLRKAADKLPLGQRQTFVNDIETLKNIPRTAPIPPQTMIDMQKNLERFGVEAQKPSIAPDISPYLTEEKQKPGIENDENIQAQNKINPLKTTPRPS